MRKNIYLYGFGGPSDMYKVVRYWRIDSEDVSVRDLLYATGRMLVEYPNIKTIYALDDRHGLHREYRDAIRSNNVEGWVMFKDICCREGMQMH